VKATSAATVTSQRGSSAAATAKRTGVAQVAGGARPFAPVTDEAAGLLLDEGGVVILDE
jgi:hypothetical protein